METIKKQRQRKLLWVLPLIAVPFILMLFWSMGGGSGGVKGTDKKKGLNFKLPQTMLPEESFTKLNYYDKAEQDSSKQADLRKKDPFYSDSLHVGQTKDGESNLFNQSYPVASEQKIMQRLKALQKVVTSPQPLSKEQYKPKEQGRNAGRAEEEGMHRLEQMMQTMQSSAEEDKEMQQINGMLENILDLQYPERVAQRAKKERHVREGEPVPVSKAPEDHIITNLEKNAKHFGPLITTNGFYSLGDITITESTENAIAATVAESQTCVNGSTVKLRLSQDILLGSARIPENTFVYGIASLKGERLTVEVNSIRYQNSVFPIELTLYDLDGLEGIYIPGAITRDVAKASAERSVQGIGLTSLSEGWEAQAAGAGVEAAKSLFTKKVKLIKVAIKSGYQVLLKEKKNSNK